MHTKLIIIIISLSVIFTDCSVPSKSFSFPTDLPIGKVDVEPTGSNSWRVLHSTAPGLRLGNCATEEGGFLTDSCVQPLSQPPSATGLKLAPENTSQLEPDVTIRPDLNNGEFRYYSTLLKVETDTNASTPIGNGKANAVFSIHRVVVEWARYRTQELPAGYQVVARPVVMGVDVGIAVRLIFDVHLTQSDVSVTSSFGFGQIAASIASSQAKVHARFEQRGTTFSFLPPNLITIASVEDFIKSLTTFYQAFTYMSAAWTAYATKGPEALLDIPESKDTPIENDPTSVVRAPLVPVGKPLTANIFKPAVIAFHISDTQSADSLFSAEYAAGYLFGVKSIAKKKMCINTKQAIKMRSDGYIRGAMRAYRNLTATGQCGAQKISDQLAKAAEAIIPIQ